MIAYLGDSYEAFSRHGTNKDTTTRVETESR